MFLRDANLLAAALERTRAPAYDDRLGVSLRRIADSVYPRTEEADAAVERLAKAKLVKYVTPHGVHARVTLRGRSALLFRRCVREARRDARDIRSVLSAVVATVLESRAIRAGIAILVGMLLSGALLVRVPLLAALFLIVGAGVFGGNVHVGNPMGILVGFALLTTLIGTIVYVCLEAIAFLAHGDSDAGGA